MYLDSTICPDISCLQPCKKLIRYKLTALKIQVVTVEVKEVAILTNEAGLLVAPIRSRIENFKFWVQRF